MWGGICEPLKSTRHQSRNVHRRAKSPQVAVIQREVLPQLEVGNHHIAQRAHTQRYTRVRHKHTCAARARKALEVGDDLGIRGTRRGVGSRECRPGNTNYVMLCYFMTWRRTASSSMAHTAPAYISTTTSWSSVLSLCTPQPSSER